MQGQLGSTGIGTFNDRLRDAVHGGSPVDGGSTFMQGFGTGLATDPNGDPNATQVDGGDGPGRPFPGGVESPAEPRPKRTTRRRPQPTSDRVNDQDGDA